MEQSDKPEIHNTRGDYPMCGSHVSTFGMYIVYGGRGAGGHGRGGGGATTSGERGRGQVRVSDHPGRMQN